MTTLVSAATGSGSVTPGCERSMSLLLVQIVGVEDVATPDRIPKCLVWFLCREDLAHDLPEEFLWVAVFGANLFGFLALSGDETIKLRGPG